MDFLLFRDVTFLSKFNLKRTIKYYLFDFIFITKFSGLHKPIRRKQLNSLYYILYINF